MKKIELFNDYCINPRSIIADLDIYLSSYEVLKRNLDILKLYKLKSNHFQENMNQPTPI